MFPTEETFDDEIENSEDQLRTLIDAIPTLVWSTRADGSFDFFNQRWLDYTGLAANQARDWGWVVAIHPDDRAGLVEYWRSLLKAGEPGEAEGRLRRSDGQYRWFLFRASPLRASSGKIVRWYGSSTDIEDRKWAEVALQAREHDSRLIVDSIPALIAIMTTAGQVESVNRQVLDYFGRSLDELKAWAFSDAVHPDDLPSVGAAWGHSVATGEPYEIEHRVRRADGVYRWFRVRGRSHLDDAGRPTRWYVLLYDIDERKRAEHRLLEAQQLGQTGSWSHDLTTGILTVTSSPELLRAYGVAPEAHSAAEVFLNIHPDDRERVQAALQKSEAEKSKYEADYRIVLPDGRIRYHHSIGRPVLNDSGGLVEFIGTALDVTDQWQARLDLEKANLALRSSERELSLIIETIPGLVWCASPEGELTYMNQRIFDYIGTSRDDLSQGGWADFVQTDERDSSVRAWSHSVATGEPFELQIRLRRHDGIYRWVHALSQLGRDDVDCATRWYGLLIDIDDRKRAEESLLGMQARLSKANQIATVAELSASIAHEINQPLTAVVANGHACLRWLAADPPNLAKANEAAGRVVRDGIEAGEVVARLRALFKRATLNKVALNLNDLIGEVLQLLRNEIVRRNVTVQADLEEGLPAVVGERIQLQQLVLNLLLNGLEAMDEVLESPKTLRIRTTQQGPESVLVEIRDSGVGLQHPSEVFEAFFTTKQHGMGMGLTICRSTVEAHQGRLWATSGDGAGATFCFTLPIESGGT